MDYTLYSNKETEEMNKQTMSFLQEYQSLVMMLFIPFYALLSRLIFINYKKYNYTEHLVIFLYAQAQMSILGFLYVLLLLLFKVSFIIVSFISLFIMLLYPTYILKRLYKLTALQTILKILIFILVVIAFFITSIITGYFFSWLENSTK